MKLTLILNIFVLSESELGNICLNVAWNYCIVYVQMAFKKNYRI